MTAPDPVGLTLRSPRLRLAELIQSLVAGDSGTFWSLAILFICLYGLYGPAFHYVAASFPQHPILGQVAGIGVGTPVTCFDTHLWAFARHSRAQ